MTKKKHDNSDFYSDWTTKKLKNEARGYHETIYKVGCYGTSDMRAYHAILQELEIRGVELFTELTF